MFAAPSLNESAATAYCDAHRGEWREVCAEFGVPCDVAECVVFPELIRYSIIQDKVETGAVRALYMNKGAAGCDFSIGRFQMKPSFVETLERRWMRSGLAQEYGLYFDTAEKQNARKVRVSRLEDERWQFLYLAIFLKMLYLDYGSYDKNGEQVQEGLETLSKREQVRLAATAYNRGCRWANPGYGSLDALRVKAKQKNFHLAIVPTRKTKYYVYGDLAVKHFKTIEKR